MLFYQVCLDIKESFDTSYYTSFLYLSLGYVINTLPLVQLYLKITNHANYTQNQLFLVLDSLNIGKYLLSSVILHEIYILIIFAFNILLCSIFLILYLLKKKNLDENVALSYYGQVFKLILPPYFWSFIGILWQILNTYLKQQNSQIYVLIIDYITIIISIVIIFVLALFIQYDIFSKKNFLKINSPKTLFCNYFALLINSSQGLFINDTDDPNAQYPIILLMVILLHSIVMHIDLPVFSNSNLNNYYQIWTLIQLAVSMNIVITYFLLDLVDKFCIFIFISAFALFYLSRKLRDIQIISSIRKYENTKMIDLRTIMYLKQQSSDNFFLLRGLILLHQQLCSNINCFYRQKKIYKKTFRGNQSLQINRETIYCNIKRLSTFFLKCTYENFKEISTDQSVQILLIELLHRKLKLYSESLILIKELNYDKLGFIEKNRVNNIKLSTQRQLKQINKQNYKSKLPFEILLFCESLIKETVQIMLNIFNLQLEFWKRQMQDKIIIKKSLENLKRINAEIEKFQALAKQILHLHNNEKVPIKNRQWFNYYFFKLYILNKKLKMQELEKLPDNIMNIDQILKDDQLDEKSSDEEPNNYYQESFLIAANTCVIQIDTSGMIKNCSNNTYQVFNYCRDFLLTSNSTILMPQIFKQYHQQFIHHFQQTGLAVNMHRRKKAFCINNNGFLVIVYKYLKYVYNSFSNKIEYIAMFRSVQTKHQYLLLNQDWEIDSASQMLQDIIGVKGLSLFILAPKALVYSNFEKYLTYENKEFFNLNLPKVDFNKKNTFYTQNSISYTRGSYSSTAGQIGNGNSQFDNKKNFQNFLNQDDVINQEEAQKNKRSVKFVSFNLRIPKLSFELVAEFQTLLNQKYKQTSCSFQGNKKLVIKDSEGKFKIVKREFIRRCKQYSELIRFQKFELIKQMFKKYTQLENCIERILRIEGTLKNSRTSNSINYIVIKIIRQEIIEEKSLSGEQVLPTPQPPTSTSPRTRRSIMSQQSQRVIINSEQYEIITNRESQVGFLLPDTQLNQDFDEIELQKAIDFSQCDTDLIKEDINKIEKRNITLIQYMYINRMLFFSQIVIALLGHFLSSYQFNNLTIQQSVFYIVIQIILVDYLYKFQAVVAESYNAEIDLYLFNSNITTSVLISNNAVGYPTNDEFYAYNQKVIDGCAYYMYIIFIEPDFIKMVYENFDSPTDESGLDVQTTYQENLYLLNLSSQVEIYGNNSISDSFRSSMVSLIFTNSFQFFNTSKQLQQQIYYQLVLIIKSCPKINQQFFQPFSHYCSVQVQLLQLDTSIKFKKNITYILYNFRFYLKFKLLSQDIIRQLLYQKLILQSVNFVTYHLKNVCIISNLDGGIDALLYDKRNELKNLKNMNYEKNSLQLDKLFEGQDTLRKITIEELPFFYSLKKISLQIILNLILIGVILFFGIILIQEIQTNIGMFTENQFMMQSENLWVLPALKEMMSKQLIQNYKFNVTYTKRLLSQYEQNIGVENPIYYQSNIDEILYLFDHNICDSDTLINKIQCSQLLNGALTRGIREYDYLLSKVVSKMLNPQDQRYQDVTLNLIYQFNKLYYFVMDHYLLCKDYWVIAVNSQLNSHNHIGLTFLIFILIGIILYFLLLNEISYILIKKREYKFIKRFYKSFLPNSALSEQKRLRVELIKAGFILK